MLRAAIVVGALVGVTACGLSPVEPDGGEGGPDAGAGEADAIPSASALRFAFSCDPRIPGEAGGREKATIESFELELEDVRAISDNASPTLASVELAWGSEYDDEQIIASFADAAPGIYSRLRAQVDSVSLTGTVTVGGQEYDYIINGEPRAASVVADLDYVSLSGTSTTTVPIEISVKEAIRAVSWSSLAPTATNGTIVLDAGDVDDFARLLAEKFEQED